MLNWSRIQINDRGEGSTSHSQARQLIAGGITHGTSSMPRHLRWPRLGMLCTKCATMKPMSALKMTAVVAKMQDCRTTLQNVSRLNKNRKIENPTKRSIDLFKVARLMEYKAG